MEIRLKRIARRDTYTIGKLYIDGKYICDTCEDKDRGLKQSDNIAVIKARKVYSQTAIPTGRYRVTLGVKSNRFGNRAQYAFCQGLLPRLINVPGFDGVLIHIGNTAEDSSGCILVGQNKAVGKVLNSTETFKKLYAILREADDNIYITIE